MQRTPNLGLPQFEPTDKYRLEDYNEAYTKIDEKIKEAQDLIDTWTQFKNSGGELNGNITAYQVHAKDSVELDGFGYVGHSNEDAIEIVNPQRGKKTRLVSKDNAGYYLAVELDGNDGAFKPNTHGIVDLGTPFINFKNLYLEGYNLGGSGYTKLPNGLIMQWGRTVIEFNNQNSNLKTVTYPITFPKGTLSASPVVFGKRSFNVAVSELYKEKVVLWGFETTKGNSSTPLDVLWIAIGY